MQKLHQSQIPSHNLADFRYRGRPVGVSHHADGDDLASAGLGVQGLRLPPAEFEKPGQPTASELRRRAIYENFRSLVDVTADGGFGRFFGPNQACPGVEIRGTLEDRTTVVVQIPENFRPLQPRLLLVPASSSRGVYGGIVLSYWGLKRGYAVILCDKGCGIGYHNLSEDRGFTTDGRLVDASSDDLSFQLPDSPDRVVDYNSRYPHRYATKHAHSGLNVESKWGNYVLESLQFAHLVCQQLWPDDYDRETAQVIATGLSNGGGASLRAAEQDKNGSIHGVAVGEPNVTPVFSPDFAIRQGAGEPLHQHSLSLLEYASLLNLYQPVASLAQQTPPAFYDPDASKRRLQELKARGAWKDLDEAEAAGAARQALLDSGILPCQEDLAASHAVHGAFEGVSVALLNCLGRYQVTDHLLGFGYSSLDVETGAPRALTAAEQQLLYTDSNGLVPGAGLQVVNDESSEVEGALKLFQAAWGKEPTADSELRPEIREIHQRVVRGLDETRATGDLRGRPAIIVNGRCDSIIAPNHASRAYLGRNLLVEGDRSRLSYLELEHGQHLDTINALPPFQTRFVPLVPYLYEALSTLEQALQAGTSLPPSQVVRTTPRSAGETGVEPLQQKHIPGPELQPGPDDRIELSDGILLIPE